jgi:hypothetical protein
MKNARCAARDLMDRPVEQTLRIYKAIAVLNVVSASVLLAVHFAFQTRDSEYAHRLVSYGHGLIRRALVGEIYSLFVSRVSPWMVDTEGFVTVAIAIGLGWMVFSRTFRVAAAQKLAIACFVFGSPFLFKNYLGTLGKFDVLGACVAMLGALLPLRAYTFIVVGVLSAVLLMVHHINATLFVPVIYGVLLIRAVAASWLPARTLILIVACSLAALAALFFALVIFADPSMSQEEFRVFLRSHATAPVPDWVASMWFSTIPEEIKKTRLMFSINIVRLPVYLILIAVHWPIIRFARRRLAASALANQASARVFQLILAVILAGYIVTMTVAFDYARFVSDCVFCLALLTAVQIFAVAGPVTDASDFRLNDTRVILLAVVVAAIPWVGMITPAIGDFAYPKLDLFPVTRT